MYLHRRPGKCGALIPIRRPGKCEALIPIRRPGKCEALIPIRRPGKCEALIRDLRTEDGCLEIAACLSRSRNKPGMTGIRDLTA